MKNNYKASLSLFPLFIIFSLLTYTCTAQSFFAGIGGNATKYSNIDFDFGKSAGFYLSVGLEGKLTNVVGYSGMLQFNNYRYDKSNLFSYDPVFMFKIFPAKEGFAFLIGAQSTNIFHTRFDGERVQSKNVYQLMYTVGATVDFNRLQVLARFNKAFETDVIENNIQLGINYKFSD